MDRKQWMVDTANATGRKHLATFAIAVIKQIMSENTTAEVKEVEIAQTLKDLDAAYGDESLPWDLTDIKKPSAPTESPNQNLQSKCTINVTKVESFLEPWFLERILNEKRNG